MELINTPEAATPIGPYSQAVRVGQMIYTSGQIGLTIHGELAEGLDRQTHQILANLEAILAAAGSSPARIVKTTIFLADLKDFAAVNAMYEIWLGNHRPARSTIQVAALPKGAVVEIEAVALGAKPNV